MLIKYIVKLFRNEMIDIANTLGSETKVTGLSPNEEEQANVEELAAEEIVGGATAGEDHVRFQAEEGAPGGVVAEELPPELPENAGVERVIDFGMLLEAHLRVREVEDKVLPLVPRVVVLEPEEQPQPVEEVHLRLPRHVRVLREVADGAQRRRRGSHLRRPLGRVVHQDVVHRNNVVDRVHRRRRRRRWVVFCAAAHGGGTLS